MLRVAVGKFVQCNDLLCIYSPSNKLSFVLLQFLSIHNNECYLNVTNNLLKVVEK